MNRRNIIFVSIIACFLMLLVPNISAIEFRNLKENPTDFNETELINAIGDRIQKLKIQNPYPKISLKEDPDGPFDGGLDDPYDWIDLFFGMIYGGILVSLLKNQWLTKAFLSGDIFLITIWMIDYGLYTYSTLTNLGDAFDIIDPDEDGY